jgi:hypothetical protein
MTLPRKIALLCIPFSLAFPTDASAQQCDMSRKSIGYRVTMCSPRGCNLGQERVDFVGEKIIHYSSAADRLGTIYQIGKTVDFCNPQLETHRPALCRDQFGPVRAQGTASFGDLKLTLTQTASETQDRYGGTITQFMHILVQACSSCVVQEISIDSILTNGQPVYRSRMSGLDICQIVDTSTLPH